MQEIRLYVNGNKEFANFDSKKFLKKIQNLATLKSGDCVNAVIETAISAATGNKLQNKKKLSYYLIEGGWRNPKTGGTV